jgi:hypothetical protein
VTSTYQLVSYRSHTEGWKTTCVFHAPDTNTATSRLESAAVLSASVWDSLNMRVEIIRQCQPTSRARTVLVCLYAAFPKVLRTDIHNHRSVHPTDTRPDETPSQRSLLDALEWNESRGRAFQLTRYDSWLPFSHHDTRSEQRFRIHR